MAQQSTKGAKAKPVPMSPQPTPKEKADDKRHQHPTN